MISSILSRLSVFNNGSVWALYLLHVIIRTALFCSLNIPLWPEGGIRLFAHYVISLPSVCRIVLKHWTCQNTWQVHAGLCLRLSPISQSLPVMNGNVFLFCWFVGLSVCMSAFFLLHVVTLRENAWADLYETFRVSTIMVKEAVSNILGMLCLMPWMQICLVIFFGREDGRFVFVNNIAKENSDRF